MFRPPIPSHITELVVNETDPARDQIAILKRLWEKNRFILQPCKKRIIKKSRMKLFQLSQGIHTLLDIFRTSTEFAESDAVLPWGRYLTRFHFSACFKFKSKKYKAASELHWPVLTWPQHLWSDLFCKNESASAETQDPRKLHICYHSHCISAVG